MKVVILTEAGQNVGFGHLTRCLSLLEAFRKKVNNVRIVLQALGSDNSIISGLNVDFKNWLDDEQLLIELLKDTSIVVIDSYLAPLSLYKRCAQIVPLCIYFDDNMRLDYPLGIVLNGNLYATSLSYPQKKNIRYFLGINYALIRPEFLKIPEKNTKEKIEQILLTVGGDDSNNVLPEIIQIVQKRMPDTGLKIIVGKNSQNFKEIKKALNTRSRCLPSLTAEEMKDVMLNSDLAISAAGQTLQELACCGVPTIAICLFDNQKQNYESWVQTGLVQDGGVWGQDRLLDNITKFIDQLKDKEVRQKMSMTGQKLIDGLGAERIVDQVLEMDML